MPRVSVSPPIEKPTLSLYGVQARELMRTKKLGERCKITGEVEIVAMSKSEWSGDQPSVRIKVHKLKFEKDT